jgi:hypothetical protein
MLNDERRKTQLKKDPKKPKPTWLTHKNMWSWSWDNNNPIKIKYKKYKNKFSINPALKYKIKKKTINYIYKKTKKIIQTSQLKNCKKKKGHKDKTSPNYKRIKNHCYFYYKLMNIENPRSMPLCFSK